ncbi:MAG: beta family protein [Minicystis sp.]
MVTPNYYVPLLRWRMGEYQALEKLSDICKARTVPLIEVLPPDYDFELHQPKKHIDEQLKPFSKQVQKRWPDRPALIDTVQIPAATRMGDGRHPLTYLFDETRTVGMTHVPVTALDRDTAYQQSIRDIHATDGRGAGLRCSLDETLDPDFGNNVEALLAQVGIAPDALDILLDLQCPAYDPQSNLIAIIIAALTGSTVFTTARSVTLLATSFPDSLSSLQYGLAFLPRREWMLYKALVAALPANLRCPGFGDYVIAAVTFAQGDMRFMRGSPNVRYTIDDGWLVAKAKRQKTGANQAYPGLCGAIVASGQFIGGGFSEGGKYIDGCRLGTEKLGNQTTWKWVATNHHITKVVADLATLSGT